eukprot:scaffold1012_cov418-Prasinococcus_capsulatus_cf.AAC.12
MALASLFRGSSQTRCCVAQGNYSALQPFSAARHGWPYRSRSRWVQWDSLLTSSFLGAYMMWPHGTHQGRLTSFERRFCKTFEGCDERMASEGTHLHRQKPRAII